VLRERVLSDLPEYRLGFILRKERHSFYQDFARAIEAAAQQDLRRRIRVTIQFTESQALDATAGMLRALGAKVQAVAASAVDHHTTLDAVAVLRERGVPTFALLSDFAQGVRAAYFGMNNLKVGRTAGWFMARLPRRQGKVAVVIGGHRWHGHELRETGFRSYLREFSRRVSSPGKRCCTCSTASPGWPGSTSPAGAWRARSPRCARPAGLTRSR
jgi:LacI family transcriptional regulator